MLKNYTKVEVDENGDKHYYNDKGELYRLDGPAVEWNSGTNFHYINHIVHRNIGPAVWYNCSIDAIWYFKNILHRVGGIAMFNEWYIQNKHYTKEDYYNIVWDI